VRAGRAFSVFWARQIPFMPFPILSVPMAGHTEPGRIRRPTPPPDCARVDFFRTSIQRKAADGDR